METPKRRLPVLQSAPAENEAPARHHWQWVGFGALAIFTAWIPLAALGGVAAAAFGRSASADEGLAPTLTAELGATLILAAALGVGAGLGGLLVGRWGAPGVGVREAALSGLAATLVADLITWVSFGATPGVLLVALVAVPSAAVGGRLGLRRRRP